MLCNNVSFYQWRGNPIACKNTGSAEDCPMTGYLCPTKTLYYNSVILILSFVLYWVTPYHDGETLLENTGSAEDCQTTGNNCLTKTGVFFPSGPLDHIANTVKKLSIFGYKILHRIISDGEIPPLVLFQASIAPYVNSLHGDRDKGRWMVTWGHARQICWW